MSKYKNMYCYICYKIFIQNVIYGETNYKIHFTKWKIYFYIIVLAIKFYMTVMFISNPLLWSQSIDQNKYHVYA